MKDSLTLRFSKSADLRQIKAFYEEHFDGKVGQYDEGIKRKDTAAGRFLMAYDEDGNLCGISAAYRSEYKGAADSTTIKDVVTTMPDSNLSELLTSIQVVSEFLTRPPKYFFAIMKDNEYNLENVVFPPNLIPFVQCVKRALDSWELQEKNSARNRRLNLDNLQLSSEFHMALNAMVSAPVIKGFVFDHPKEMDKAREYLENHLKGQLKFH